VRGTESLFVRYWRPARMKSRTRASRTLCGYRKAQARATRIDFTAGSYVSHSVRFVQAHSLESGVCENGSVFGEKARTVQGASSRDAR
jgi:hypothetical protein